MFDTLIGSINYVINASFFYPAMGMTAATSIWIGAAFYNGEIKAMWKGIIAIGAYAALLLITTIPRVIEAITEKNVLPARQYMAYAGSVTILFITLYYVLGIIIGVYTVKRIKRRR